MIDISCQDCLEFLVDIEDETVDLVLTDPPYNINRGGRNTEHAVWTDAGYEDYADNKSDEEYWNWLGVIWEELYRILKPKAHFLFTCAQKQIWKHRPLCEDIGFTFRHQGIWHSPNRKAGSFPGMWPFAYEPVLDFTKGGFRRLNNGNCVGYMDVWVEPPPSSIDHPTPRPIDMWTELVELTTNEGEMVIDPFCGSGTTPLVCKNLNRNCRTVDISDKYVILSQERCGNV